MRGFELIRLLRDDLIALGGHVIAPCRINTIVRFPQTTGAILRSVSHGPRYTDASNLARSDTKTKFSYIVASKHLGKPVNARVIRHPLRHSGHTHMRLCTGDGLQTITVTRSDNEYWPRAGKIEWGDQWP